MALLAVLGSTLLFNSPPVFAASASVGCGSVITTNTTLKANIGPCPGNGIIIAASGVTLNCFGHTISGTGTISSSFPTGISFAEVTGVTVKNCIVTGFMEGFMFVGSSGNTITGNTAVKNLDNGFLVYSDSGDTFTSNSASGNNVGFLLYSTSGSTLSSNTASGNGVGFALAYSASSNTLIGNTAMSNFGPGFYILSSGSNILKGNTANKNADSGFYVDSSSNANTLSLNTANSNAKYGYYDLSTGSGTKGTANFYASDTCRGNGVGGSTPIGLGTP